MDIKAILPLVILTLLVSACSSFSHTNKELPDTAPEPTQATFDFDNCRGEPKARATFDIDACRGDEQTLVIMSLSGGGSRAAYLSATVMLKLETVFETKLLHDVDAISSVSGGSLPAAYYAISSDKKPSDYGRIWDDDTVKKLMKKNYIRKWFTN